jgi:tetratricopeptide (TPR) repeat protein
MQPYWKRYAWALLVLVVVAALAFLLSMLATRREQSADSSANDRLIARSYNAFDNNDLNGAIAAADELLARDPRHIEALLAKAAALAQKGSLEFKENEYGPQAIAVAQQVLAIDPDNAEAWRHIGYANEIMQNYAAAHDAYGKVMALDPKNAPAVAGDAHAWDLQGDMVKAEAGYRAALALDPNLVAAKAGLARVLVFENKPDEALPLYISVADTPGNARQRAEAAYSAGQLEESAGQYSAAEIHFRSATTLDAIYALGWTGLAIELFRQSVAKDTALPSENRGALINESLASLAKATALNPNQSLAHYQLATEMVAMNRPSDAVVILKGLKKQIINNDITLSFGAKAVMQQKVQSALDAVMKLRSSQ